MSRCAHALEPTPGSRAARCPHALQTGCHPALSGPLARGHRSALPSQRPREHEDRAADTKAVHSHVHGVPAVPGSTSVGTSAPRGQHTPGPASQAARTPAPGAWTTD